MAARPPACLRRSTSAPGKTGRLKLRIEEGGKPVPARVHLLDPAGKVVRAEKLPFWHDHFVCGGEVVRGGAKARDHQQIPRAIGEQHRDRFSSWQHVVSSARGAAGQKALAPIRRCDNSTATGCALS